MATVLPREVAHALPPVPSWELVRSIGRGRFSRVFLARPARCPADWPADYVVKLADDQGPNLEYAEATFCREWQVARLVSHPNLATVLAVRKSPLMLVMPYLPGCTLKQYLDSSSPAPLPWLFWLARQAAEALSALHNAGWLHADIKPANLMISPDGHATLIDLGLARQLDTEECGRNAPRVGSPAYAAPEIQAGQCFNAAADIYSLGIVLFEMLCGKTPFQGDAETLALGHLTGRLPEMRTLRPGLPVQAISLARRMLAKEPLRRPSAEEAAAELRELEISTFGDWEFACSLLAG